MCFWNVFHTHFMCDDKGMFYTDINELHPWPFSSKEKLQENLVQSVYFIMGEGFCLFRDKYMLGH